MGVSTPSFEDICEYISLVFFRRRGLMLISNQEAKATDFTPSNFILHKLRDICWDCFLYQKIIFKNQGGIGVNFQIISGKISHKET